MNELKALEYLDRMRKVYDSDFLFTDIDKDMKEVFDIAYKAVKTSIEMKTDSAYERGYRDGFNDLLMTIADTGENKE